MESKRMMGFCVISVMAMGLLATLSNAIEINEISCTQALVELLPCKDYLMGSGPDQPPVACCQNAQALYQQATSTQIRRDLCNCLKNAAAQMGVNVDRAKNLAPACGISLPFPIDPKIDCNTVPLERLMMERFN
ncbi:hypothetical protein L6164_035968 [Bauhinia variegata]|uniref:Uncharacterized protein n=1 Tax=Bauhinia variegata TaxID=167791 RepID=A0ACB9KFK7_BAUVA|nr:hypothetical protein L6164_035968 [Bauhinia variegata]